MHAVIRTGGKQYLVKPGQRLRLEKLPSEAGKTVIFDEVLLVAGDQDLKVGTPKVAGAAVKATVVDHGKAKKVSGIKFHNKVRYKRTIGHRQPYTTVKIDTISA